MEQRISLITLGVTDVTRAGEFYELLGWRGQPARQTFYGGYAGCFADPDGHIWEIAHNPGFPLGPDGGITIPDFGSHRPTRAPAME